jgi:hypothetical protein
MEVSMSENLTATHPVLKAGDKVMLRQGYGGQLMPAIVFDIVKDNQERLIINGAFLNGNEIYSFSVYDGDQEVTLFPESPMHNLLLDIAKTRVERDIINYQSVLNQSEQSRINIDKTFGFSA